MSRTNSSRLPSRFLCLAAAMFFSLYAAAQDDVPLRALKDELARSVKQLQLRGMDKPYFIAYRMDETNETTIGAKLGSLTHKEPARRRIIGVEVRVGDYALDNSNYFSLTRLRGGFADVFNSVSGATLDDNYEQIRRQLWLATDTQYKKALEDLSGKRAALQMRKRTEDVPDFSKETPATVMEPPEQTGGDRKELESLARNLSAVFRSSPEIYRSSVEIQQRNFYTRYVNSEGTTFTRSQPLIKLQVSAETQAEDGLPLTDTLEFYGRSRPDLPSAETLLEQVKSMASRLQKLRSAPAMDRYNGPVLFEGVAAGEIFAQQFASGLMAVRAPMSDEPRFEVFFNQMMGQMGGASFLDKLGGRMLPDFLSVTDDPLQREYRGAKLLGASRVDDDGVKTRQTVLVEKGVLKTLLATRTPVRSIPQSSGSRRGWGASPSNLFLNSEKSVSAKTLREDLLRRVHDRGLPYGIVVRRVGGGASASFMRAVARMAANPDAGPSGTLDEVYRLYPDGHEELVRGMELSDVSPSAFKDIVAVGDTPSVFTDEFVPRLGSFFSLGLTAASNVPIVSCVVPPLLFDELSLVRAEGPFPSPPISPSPLAKQ
jgi:predicted Zn-dependent protease